MKRTISIFLSLVMALPLCACGGKSNETELTLDNYSTYLTVSASVSDPGLEDAVGVHSYNNGYGIPYDGGSTLYLYNHLNTAVTVVGSSTNFNYNDVSVTVRFAGTYKTVDLHTCEWGDAIPVDMEVVAECNISGNGQASDSFSYNDECNMDDSMANVEWEVVAVSGTVSPA